VYKKDGSQETLTLQTSEYEEQISQLIVDHIRQYLSLNTIDIVDVVDDNDNDMGGKHKTYERELYVSSISFETTEEDLRNHFKPYGDLAKVKLIYRNGRSAGKAFVAYTDENMAKRAI